MNTSPNEKEIKYIRESLYQFNKDIVGNTRFKTHIAIIKEKAIDEPRKT